MMKRNSIAAWIALVALGLAASQAGAGAHAGPGGMKKLGQYSGFEGSEEALGTAVAEAIADLGAQSGRDYDFSGREKELGLAVAMVIKTMGHNSAYQHETNDALVKMTLTHIQFAKDHGLVEEMIDEETRIQFPMLNRVRGMIEKTGNQELALIAVTEQTTCFWQLVPETQREPGRLSYRSPFARVLEQTRRLGQHDLTEQEIHEIWTVPRLRRSAEVLGVDLQISDWSEDGIVTISLPEARMASAD